MPSYSNSSSSSPSFPTVKVAIALSILAIFFFIGMGTYTVIPAGEIGVVQKAGGAYDPMPLSPGVHGKTPFYDSVLKEDVRMHVVNYSAANKDANDSAASDIQDGIIAEPAIQVLDTKNVGYGIDLTVQFTPIASDMPTILAQYGENYFDKAIHPLIRAVARDVGGQYGVEDIAAQRGQFEAKLLAGLEERFKGLPFTLNGVQMRNIDLPDNIKERITQVQQAQQEKQKLDVQAQQAVVQRQIIDTQAGAAADKLKIEAQGEADAILAKATAQAKAYQLQQQTLTPLLVENNRINAFKEKWDGALPQYILGGGSAAGGIMSLLNLPAAAAATKGGSGGQ